MLSAARLEAQILSEMALAHEANGRFGEADALLREGLALTELRYPESASVNAAKARLAAFLSRRGQRDEALALYRAIVDDVSGKRGALVGLENQIKPYFTMLVEDLPQRPELVADLFLAAQLIERPGAAQTLSQLARQLSAGTGEASELFRRATAVDRELTRVNLQIAQIQRAGGRHRRRAAARARRPPHAARADAARAVRGALGLSRVPLGVRTTTSPPRS